MRIFLLLLCFALSLAANEPTKSITNQVIQDLKYTGSLETVNVNVEGLLEVIGLLNAKQTRFFELDIKGDTYLDNCIVSGPAIVDGALQANQTVFEDELDVSGSLIIFESSVANEIYVSPAPDRGKQVVKLLGGSVVKGNIIFESKQGEVILPKESKLLGVVVGGEIKPFAH